MYFKKNNIKIYIYLSNSLFLKALVLSGKLAKSTISLSRLSGKTTTT